MQVTARQAYPMIGSMPMPANFKYRDVLRRGRPRHEKWDSFSLKHPPMTPGRWAKIFSPFDALDGFDERIAEKEIQYQPKTELCEDDAAELNRRLDILHNLTWNGRMARQNNVAVSVTYFVPCADANHSAYHFGAGRYETVTGTVLSAEMDTLKLRTDAGEMKISFDSIRELTGMVFDMDWELYIP